MCPDREILSIHADGEIGAPWNATVDAHVAACAGCRAVLDRIRETRRLLLAADSGDMAASMERVRLRLLSAPPRPRSSIWRRSIDLPVPLAVLAAALLVFLGLAVALLALRVDLGPAGFARSPAAAVGYQFGVPMDQLEMLLGAGEETVALPKNVKLVPAREPFLGKEAEFLRLKQ